MRLIDADALKIPSTSVDMFENCRNCRLLDEEQVREIIDNAPTIDAVEVVRCAVCNKWKPQGYEYGYGWCLHHQSETRADDFCSYGEREGE